MSQQNNNGGNVRKNSNIPNSKGKSKKKKKPVFKLSSVFFIFFIVYICSFVAYMFQANSTGDIPTKEDSSGIGKSSHASVSDDEDSTEVNVDSEDQAEVTTVTVSSQVANVVNPVPESETVDEDYLETCLFVGDSISTGYSGYLILDEKNVLAKNGLHPGKLDTTTIEYEGEEVLAIDGVVKSGFKNIYIMLGSNGLGWATNEDMVDGYRNFIQQIQQKVEDANIYIVSVPPVSAKKEDTSEYPTVEEGLVYNTTIDELNAQYLDLANELGVHYLDINSYLKDDTGKLPYDSSSDGMHFDLETYNKVLEYVRCHVAE
jgi:lysophospholipase L1-like esterase